MKKMGLIYAIVLFSIISNHSALAALTLPVTSTFDTDADGWTWDPLNDAAFSWEPTGGNPGGYIRYDDNLDAGPLSGILAPPDFLGDWQASLVTNLTYDVKIFSTGSVYLIGQYQVWISGPGGFAKWLGPSPNPAAGWLSLDVPITESEWTIQSGSWDDLLDNVTELFVRTEFYNNWGPFEITGIDNVSLIPAPGAIVLGGIGIGLVGWLRRRKAL